MILLAMIPENPVVGGTVLRRAAIQSPNFATGSAGWSINQDGSAEFNNVVIRGGQIVSGSALYYSTSPPAANKLIASVSAAGGTDAYGNVYLAGVFNYLNNGIFFQASGMESGNFQQYTAATEAGPWTPVNEIVLSGTHDFLIQSTFGEVDIAAATLVAIGAILNANSGATVSANFTGGTPVLDVTNNGSATAPILRVTAAAINDLLAGLRVAGDTNARIILDTSGAGAPRLRLGSGSAAPDTVLSRPSANLLQLLTADLDIATAGRGLQIKEGSNARMGTAVLGGGTGQALVANTSVTANTRIFLTNINPGGTVGFLHVGGIIAGSSFSIISSNAADTSTIAWLLVEPG